ncbi:DUF1501 domain-containing protein [Paraburkholderia denitrificans]|uniref:DUF1501 domain-containing protein n=1 Tax=Paraburkholderia denitrificans TaxID=694025 RepID=A0ABW0J4X2_9BURK
MKRREFLAASAAAGMALWLPGAAHARSGAAGPFEPGYDNLLILVELKGGNDGLNTVVPFADPLYRRYRANIGVRRDRAIQLDERTALHPALAPLMPMWRARRLAIVQGVGYAQPNLSHFRSTEIWDTASRPDQYLRDGWLARAFANAPVPTSFATDGLVLGSAETGPLANGERVITLVNPARLALASRLITPTSLDEPDPTLARLLDVERDILKVADRLRPRRSQQYALKTVFPPGPFGTSIKTAMQVLASGDTVQGVPVPGEGIAAIRLTLNGFDTHENQPGRHAALLHQFAAGMVAMRDALVELGRWDRTMIVTYAEFGRSVRENPDRGTDHGTACAHFVAGGRIAGGLYGQAPQLARLDGDGNLPAGVDFRQLYATVLGPWWGLDAQAVLQDRFQPLPVLRV